MLKLNDKFQNETKVYRSCAMNAFVSQPFYKGRIYFIYLVFNNLMKRGKY